MHNRSRFKISLALAMATAHLILHVSTAAAQITYETIIDFAGTSSTQPWGGVIEGADGAFYGTTQFSDPTGCGTVYRIASDGSLTTLHQFVMTNGCNPVGELVQAADGNLYGTTFQGGPNGGGSVATRGTGTIFKITPGGELTMLHAFASYDELEMRYPEGIWPFAGLTLGTDGNLYGLTNYGGQGLTGPAGTIFKITPAGAFTLLHSLEAAEGAFANSGLTLGSDGNFYGTTTAGGNDNNGGSVFRVTPAGVVTRLFAFPYDNSCACTPYGFSPLGEPVEDAEGNLYGTNYQGGPGAIETAAGTVWKLSPSGEITLLHAFTVGSNGASPTAGLTVGADGNLYGTTYGGTVFQISLAGALTTLHSFVESAGPDGRLLEASPGVFIGTTQGGGAGGKGLVFRLTVGSTTTTSLAASPNSSVFGEQVTFTASVSSGSGTPAGQVEFFDGTASIGLAVLNGGAAVLTTTSLAVGAHSLSATYAGEGGFLPSTSSIVPVTIARAQTTMSLGSSPNPSSRKQFVTVTATLTAVSPGAGTPTGQVHLFDGKKRLGTATLLNGTAVLQVSFNAMGQHALRGVYAGNGNFTGTEGAFTHTVER